MGRGRSTAAGILSRKAGLPPIMRIDARVLILGSLPGDASLAASQYYAHPRNQFWQLAGTAIGVDLTRLRYPERLEALQTARIALWDVVGEAHRPGSLDQKIRDVQVNDLRAIIELLPQLRVIAFNGQMAAKLARTMFDAVPIVCITLPSSSPAYTLALGTKQTAWLALAAYLEPSEHVTAVAG